MNYEERNLKRKKFIPAGTQPRQNKSVFKKYRKAKRNDIYPDELYIQPMNEVDLVDDLMRRGLIKNREEYAWQTAKPKGLLGKLRSLVSPTK